MDIKIVDLKKLVDEHGSNQTLGGLLASRMHKLPYVCPKCKGAGGEQVRYNAYPSGLPDSGWVDDWKYKWVDCSLCNAEGYTAEEMISRAISVEYVPAKGSR